MRRLKVASTGTLKTLPEGEWVHIPEGLPAEFVDDYVEERFLPDFIRRVQKAHRDLTQGKGVVLRNRKEMRSYFGFRRRAK